MKGGALTGAVLVAALLSFTAEADMFWAPAPLEHAGHGHGGHGRNSANSFLLKGGEGASASLLLPDLSRQELPGGSGGIRIRPTGMDNYHALVASRNSGALHESAIRYVYMHGKPSGESPELLIKERKMTLEIEPAPLAREHWRYLSAEAVRFLIRFRGEPLAGARITMQTANGSFVESVSNVDGYIEFVLPDDFPDVKPGRRSNRPSEFVMTASHSDGRERFVSTLSSAYYANPSHWQSLPLGMATAFGGMLIGGMLTFRNLRGRGK